MKKVIGEMRSEKTVKEDKKSEILVENVVSSSVSSLK